MERQFEIKDKSALRDGLKVARFRQHVRKTDPHRHNNYFEIIYLTQGKGSHTIDTVEYAIAPPVIFMVRKEQVHFWDITSEPDGFVLIIKKEFIESCIDRDIKLLIGELSHHTCLFPADPTPDALLPLMIQESRKNGRFKRQVLEGLLKAFFAKLLEAAGTASHVNITNSLLNTFIQLLQEENRPSNLLKHFAQRLNTTPQNLNAICRKELGRSASEVVAENLIGEAKRQLTYTDRTVSEIAFSLGFTDASHFVKYFKRHTGITPRAFAK